MSRFYALFQHDTPPPAGQIYADERSELFPAIVQASFSLELWPAGRFVPPTGSFLLLGVFTWSGYDMLLLDVMEGATDRPDCIGVFDLQEMQTPDFSNRIPGLTDVMMGPVAGLWIDGQLVEAGSGHDAREIAFRACHLNLDEIADRLDPYRGMPILNPQ